MSGVLLCSPVDHTILHRTATAAKGGDFYLGTFGDFTSAIDNSVHDPASDPTVGLREQLYCLWCQEIVLVRILEKSRQLAEPDDPDDINELGKMWHQRWLSSWRPRYRHSFDVDRQLRDREAWYADPANRIALLKNHDLLLWNSDLYKVPLASELAGGNPPSALTDEELLLLMSAA